MSVLDHAARGEKSATGILFMTVGSTSLKYLTCTYPWSLTENDWAPQQICSA